MSDSPTPQQIAGRASAAKALAENAARDERIRRLRADGWTLEAIGADVGLTHQRVRAILNRRRAA